MHRVFPYDVINEFAAGGVDIFFTISGFIMALVIEKENDPKIFIKKRMARIYPTYWEIYFLTILLWLIVRGGLGFHFMTHASWGAHLTLLPFDMFTKERVLGVAWTLYYEIFFYIIIAISLCLFKNPKHGIYIFFIGLLFIGFSPYTIFDPKISQYFTIEQNYFFEFIAGFTLLKFLKQKNIIDLAIAIICLFLCCYWMDNSGYFLLFSMIFLSIGYFLDKREAMPKINWLLKVGDSSYSLYLIHMPLLYLCNALAKDIESKLGILALMTVFITAIIYLAIINFEFFEKKVAKKLRVYL